MDGRSGKPGGDPGFQSYIVFRSNACGCAVYQHFSEIDYVRPMPPIASTVILLNLRNICMGLPGTTQVAAVPVKYDPVTGRQMPPV
jgi:hypothetical protein